MINLLDFDSLRILDFDLLRILDFDSKGMLDLYSQKVICFFLKIQNIMQKMTRYMSNKLVITKG